MKKTKWEIYTSKVAFHIGKTPVSLFVVHFAIAVAVIVLIERLT